MLSIGFSTEYYTLWDVESEIRWDTSGDCPMPYQKISYTYLQNLSIDKEKAIEKAKQKGVKNLEPDHDLYGRNRSWAWEKKLFCEMPKSLSPFFEYGKFFGQKIVDCVEFGYLAWYYSDCKNRYAKQICLANNYYEIGDSLYPESYYLDYIEREKRGKAFMKKAETGTIEFTPLKNLNVYGQLNIDGVFLLFPNYKLMEYAGFEYALPVVNGKGKKIKNNNIQATVKVIDEKTIEVLEFTIIK